VSVSTELFSQLSVSVDIKGWCSPKGNSSHICRHSCWVVVMLTWICSTAECTFTSGWRVAFKIHSWTVQQTEYIRWAHTWMMHVQKTVNSVHCVVDVATERCSAEKTTSRCASKNPFLHWRLGCWHGFSGARYVVWWASLAGTSPAIAVASAAS